MLQIYFYLLVGLVVAMIVPVLWKPDLIYQYPHFMAATFAVFILPQAYSLYRNQWGGVYLEMTLLACVLCVSCCWLGYRLRAHPGLLNKLNVQVISGRFLAGGIALVVIAWGFSRQFGALSEDQVSSQMTGIGTIYLFFAGLIYPGFAICFYCALKDGGAVAWLASAVAVILPIQATVFAGRRESTMLLILTLGLSLYFIKGIKPFRILVLAAIAGAIVLIPATGEYRTRSREDPLEALQEIDFGEQLEASMDETALSELKNSTALMAATEATGDYQFGADYWNALVFRFVPAQFVGKNLKDSLMIGGVKRDFSDYVERTLGFPLPMGTTVTGVGDSFNQFGYFGCLFFAALGYLFKTLWAAANRPNGIIAQVLYIEVTTSAMRAVTHESIDFLPGFVYSAIFIGLIAWYAKDRVFPQPIEQINMPANADPALPR